MMRSEKSKERRCWDGVSTVAVVSIHEVNEAEEPAADSVSC